MTTFITYGAGGYCQNCKPNHEHPLNNITKTVETGDVQSPEEASRKSGMEKLLKLGLTEEESNAIFGLATN